MIATFTGEIDFSSRLEFRNKLIELADADVSIIDLSDAAYIDSAAISEILWLARNRRKTGRQPPRIVVGPRVARILEVTGINAVAPLFATLREAEAG
jgi:anti-sigma B factor antagonist